MTDLKYRANLKKIEVPLQKLLLDPNNPRFLDDHGEPVPEAEWGDGGVQVKATSRMQEYKLSELKKSILTNGWQPVDMIFVKKVKELPDSYVVLEGNRRVTALRDLADDLPAETRLRIDPLPVLEVLDSGDLEQTKQQISYLLGVRHHGSLKTWGPFAQAHDLYERYLSIGNMTDETFSWDENIAVKIADQISLNVTKIKERIRVYRVMKQLNEVPEIREVGVPSRYYSLINEALPTSKSNLLSDYLKQDPNSLRVDAVALKRLDDLCHFSKEKREGAPISSPDEWRPLSRILKDLDPDRKARMLEDVSTKKMNPTVVFAERQAELKQLRWDLWLQEVSALVSRLQIANVDTDDVEACKVVSRLANLLDALSARRPLKDCND